MKQFKLVYALAGLLLYAGNSRAASYTANDVTSLASAYSSCLAGDTIKLTGNIVLDNTFTISKAIVVNGQGYSLSVPNVGMSDAGVVNASANGYRAIAISGSNIVTLYYLTIKGGNVQGAGIYIPSGSTVKLSYCTVSNCTYTSFGGGGGIYNAGTCYLYKTAITRNAAGYAGGFYNTGASAKMFVEYSTITENRSLASNGGGGGGVNYLGAYLYINNSTFSNNQSTELGGGLNNYNGTLYIANTSFTGNVSENNIKGGALAVNGGSADLLNCLFAYNYYKSAPVGAGPPTTLTLNDIHSYAGTTNLYYCTFMDNTINSGTINQVVGNTVHALAADGSTNDIFTGGINTTMYGTDGQAYGTATYFQPYLIKVNGVAVPTLKTSSWALAKGVRTAFTNGSGTPAMGYYNGSTWTSITGTATAAMEITNDETSSPRASTPAVGAIERTLDNFVSLKVFASPNGTVNNASIYGDLYASGSTVKITAIPNTGYAFSNFAYNQGGSGTVATNPLSLTLTQNTILTPNFATTTGFTVTYLDNGSTGGTLPSPSVSTYSSGATATIVGNTGNLTKNGYTFGGWNLLPNGSSNSYPTGSTYSSSSAANLTLYAIWNSTGVPVPLPIKLLNFEVSATSSRTAILKWEASAQNSFNEYFEIERSLDASTWETIGKLAVASSSVENVKYNYEDRDAQLGLSFYRLKFVGQSNEIEYSTVKSINIKAKYAGSSIVIFPNPANTSIFVSNATESLQKISIFDAFGKNVTDLVEIKTINEKQSSIAIERLAKGVYFLHNGAQGNASRFVVN